mmetsp:Transcript_38779/g.74483  ORF Transcript_38779/g.74483 Transcript_38779/m.74483 type:complete len:280 (+) Transcript_38779:753-1592(+)
MSSSSAPSSPLSAPSFSAAAFSSFFSAGAAGATKTSSFPGPKRCTSPTKRAISGLRTTPFTMGSARISCASFSRISSMASESASPLSPTLLATSASLFGRLSLSPCALSLFAWASTSARTRLYACRSGSKASLKNPKKGCEESAHTANLGMGTTEGGGMDVPTEAVVTPSVSPPPPTASADVASPAAISPAPPPTPSTGAASPFVFFFKSAPFSSLAFFSVLGVIGSGRSAGGGGGELGLPLSAGGAGAADVGAAGVASRASSGVGGEATSGSNWRHAA